MPTVWPLTARRAHLQRLGQWYADRSVGGVVFTGPAGVGKTRLGDEALQLAAGRPTARAIGHPSMQDIPLGALAHLLPSDVVGGLDDSDDERAGLFHRAHTELRNLAHHHRLLLLLDDADQLDETTLALLLPLTVQRVVFPIATIRTGRPLPAVLASLIKDGHLVVEHVDPLRSNEVATLLHRVLDGPVTAETVDRLAAASDGNLQMLYEIVQHARADGALAQRENVWTLTELTLPTALDELIAAQLAGLDDRSRAATEILAVSGLIGLADLEHFTSSDVIDDLDQRRIVRATRDGQRVTVQLAHPMYGEIIRGRLSVLRDRAIRRQLADRLDEHGLRRREDVTRHALWCLGGGRDVDPGTLLGAARMALAGRDVTLARRFAEAAAHRGARHDASRVMAEAATITADHSGLHAAVDKVWEDIDLPDGHRAHLARRLAQSCFAAGDMPAAMAVLDDADRRITDPVAHQTIVALRAALLANAGKPVDALDAIESVIGDIEAMADPRLRIELATAHSIALITIGRYDDALAAARRGEHAQRELPDWLARRGMATHVLNQAHAYNYSGRYAEARTAVERVLPAAESAGALAATVWLRITLGEIERDRGCGSTAVEHFTIATEMAERAGQRAAGVWAVVGIAQGHLLLGNLAEAEAALDAADKLGHSPVATSWATRERTRALLVAARGDLDAACDRLREIAEVVAADSLFGFESTLHYDIVRFGQAGRALPRLRTLAGWMQSPLAEAMCAHASAAATGDVDLFVEAVDALEGTGAMVFAAECATVAATRADAAGRARDAAQLRRRAHALVASVGGARTPALAVQPAVDPLTAREREVATLATSGLGSKEIAAALFVSKRTVEAHLDHIYRKLGVHGRSELAEALITTE
jgi:DNA-binding CsgD family transcriptional regulator